MFNYAQIDEQGICIGTSSLAAMVILPHLITIDIADESPIGKRWDGQQWLPVEQTEPET